MIQMNGRRRHIASTANNGIRVEDNILTCKIYYKLTELDVADLTKVHSGLIEIALRL